MGAIYNRSVLKKKSIKSPFYLPETGMIKEVFSWEYPPISL